ncbi:hypothetical protein [Wenjunlia tyrosinilytica]|uniref:Uncharacterized protein n=1 Tax=Wenjunlia tyrosinilytica TaxID=1544741 RepID=A0A918E237_9ACTN|nr:hypothetical protein [Wenjunlia tyrosinilytica]GGO99665.1 hypothetical protein GCM10012280_66630 [Wenjunlia tyrosinilytica]
MQHALNYLGQLRIYSYVDLLLLFQALHAGLRDMVGLSLLWFGFLIHLEWQHRDMGRLRWPWPVWALLWIAGVVLVADPMCVPFLVLAAGYSLKKRIPFLAAVSPLINAGLKVALIEPLPGAHARQVLLVFVLMTIRNLLGDVRDAAKDAGEGVASIPVRLGYRRHTPLVYPLGLAVTSAVWVAMAGLPWWVWCCALAVQALTYRLTPR